MSYVFEQLTKTNEFKQFEELSSEMSAIAKPNPNGYPIIDKWNYKYVLLPYQNRMYKAIEAVLNVGLPAAYEAEIDKFASIEEIVVGDKQYGEAKKLPELWRTL